MPRLILSLLLCLLSISRVYGEIPAGGVFRAKYGEFNLSYGLALDYRREVYVAAALRTRPITLSFSLDASEGKLHFLDNQILLRLHSESLLRGAPEETNYYALTLLNGSLDAPAILSGGLSLMRLQIRDSLRSTVVDWLQGSLGATLLASGAHKLSLMTTPFFRTHIPYAADKATTQQLWLPVKAVYGLKTQLFSFSLATTYIAVNNFSADTLVHYFLVTANADYALSGPDAAVDLRLFVDGQLWLQSQPPDHQVVREAMDLSSLFFGLRVRF